MERCCDVAYVTHYVWTIVVTVLWHNCVCDRDSALAVFLSDAMMCLCARASEMKAAYYEIPEAFVYAYFSSCGMSAIQHIAVTVSLPPENASMLCSLRIEH